MTDGYERILLVKNECLVYRLPPRPSNRGYKAADWGLDKPQWTGRLKVVVVNEDLAIKLEDRSGQLFARAPVDSHPGVSVESVTDSSRYFVLRIKDPSGRSAFIGAGFADRGDAFDFNVALQDHFKRAKVEEEIERSPQVQPNLDLGLKEGQTFKIKLGNTATSKPKATKAKPLPGGLLPPPPVGGSTAPVAKETTSNSEWGEFSSSTSGGNDWVQF